MKKVVWRVILIVTLIALKKISRKNYNIKINHKYFLNKLNQKKVQVYLCNQIVILKKFLTNNNINMNIRKIFFKYQK